MSFTRAAGILLHPTSLPGPYGTGDLGPEAFRFIDFLESAGQSLWQVFPLGPTGYGDSPYQCLSAFAGNPLLISLDFLVQEGLLTQEDIANPPSFNPELVDFGWVIGYKNSILQKAYENHLSAPEKLSAAIAEFKSKNAIWLDDFSLFMAVKNAHGGKLWTEWETGISRHEPQAIAEWNEKLSKEVGFFVFIQYFFNKQWQAVKKYANSKHIRIIGDLPIFVSYDSSDVWANRHLFTVDANGKLETVAGVPPDYFSATGQLWGNPLYRWNKMQEDGFEWWINRFRFLFTLVDIARIDHFRGFEAFWEIPGDAPTAVTGRWVKAPGDAFFTRVREVLGNAPIIAEDLGVITDEVRALRDKFDFPGIKILQFAFGTGMERKFLPHNLIPNCCVLTGSHDNDTTRGFYEAAKTQDNDIFISAQKYLNYYGEDICPPLIHAAYASVAKIVVIPMQDILNLGTEARMNFPGKLGGNWGWRFTPEQVHSGVSEHYHELARLFERLHDSQQGESGNE